MRKIRAEYIREFIVRQQKVARRPITEADGLAAVVGADAERARARNGRTAAVRREIRDVVRIEIQRTACSNVHDACTARVFDLARRQRHIIGLARAVRADFKPACTDCDLARFRRLDNNAVVCLEAVDRNRLASIVAENKLGKFVAEELAVELVTRDMEPRARRRVVKRQVTRRLACDDKTALADDIRRIVIRRRRDDPIRMDAQSPLRIRARVELCTRVKLYTVARHVDPDRRGTGDNLHLGILIQHDIAAACIEGRHGIIALDLQRGILFQMDVAARIDADLCAFALFRRACAFHMDRFALLDGKAAIDHRVWRTCRRIRTDRELRTLALNGEVVTHLDAELARRIDGLLDRAAVKIDVLLTRDVEAAEAAQGVVDRAVGNAEICSRCICGIVADIDVLSR